nr:MAG TPA: hypothetical protein [Caudoviricetes sp.]DAV43779.1 MAG TPA: hypothetical protein [Caudoviricetes sp.]
MHPNSLRKIHLRLRCNNKTSHYAKESLTYTVISKAD